MSKTRALYHIVFCTKYRKMTIPLINEKELYSYIWGIIKNNNCRLLQIGGMQNHIHLLIDLHPSLSLSSLVREIKSASNKWITQNRPHYPMFENWASEYYACSISPEHIDNTIKYIQNQKIHHLNISDEEELKRFSELLGFPYHPQDLT